MKKVLIIFLIIGIATIFYFYFFPIIFPPQNPTKMLEEIFKKAEKTNEFKVGYNISLSLFLEDIGSEIKGNAILIHKNGKSKTTFNFERYPSSYFFEFFSPLTYEYECYTLPEGEIRCYKSSIIEPRYECEEVKSLQPLEIYSPLSRLNLIKEWKDKNIVNISYLGSKNIIGRKCDNFRFDVNLEKLIRETTEFPLFITKNANFSLFSCYDESTGIPLIFSYSLDTNDTRYSRSIKMGFEANSFSSSAEIDEITLPVPYEKVKWLPNFQLLETLCKPNSNEVKVAIKATKYIPSSSANLTLKFSTYGQSGDIYISSSYAYEGSHCVFINPENDNRGGEENYIYKTIDFGSSGKITWRWMVDEDAKKYCGFRKLSYWLDGSRKNVLDFCEVEKEKWYEYSLMLNGTHKIGIGVYSPGDGNNDWDAAIDYIEVEKEGRKTTYSFEDGSLQGWETYNSYGYKTQTFTSTILFNGAKKDEIKILNFTLPITLEKDKSYSGYLYIGNLKQIIYCSTYQPSYYFTGFFTQLLEKLKNITQSTF